MEKIFRWLLHILEKPMERYKRITQPTTKPTPQNKIYYRTQLLDILIKNVNGQIITDIYHKPTDTQQYLHFKNHQPQNCIKSIPYTLARKIRTINTDKNLKEIASKKYTQPYTRGYPKTLINQRLELTEKIPQRELKNTKKHNNEKPVAYVATYNKNNPELFTEIRKNHEELKNKEKVKEI